MGRWIGWFVAGGVVAGCFSAAVRAGDCPAQLRMAYNSSWLPYIEVTDEEIRGSDVQLIRHTLAQAGSALQLRYVPESRAIQMLRQGDIDVLFAASYTKERAAYAWFSQPYRQEQNAVLVHRQTLQLYPEIKERAYFLMLAARRLVGTYNPSGFYGEDFEAIKQQQPVKNRSLAVFEADRRWELVVNRRADYTIVDRDAAVSGLRSHPAAASLLLLPFSLNSAPVHLMLSKQTISAACVALIDQQLPTNRITAHAKNFPAIHRSIWEFAQTNTR